jgi:hypothetical protein
LTLENLSLLSPQDLVKGGERLTTSLEAALDKFEALEGATDWIRQEFAAV